MAVDVDDVNGAPVPEKRHRAIVDRLESIEGDASPISLVDDVTSADWVLRLDGSRVLTIPAEGISEADVLQPIPVNARLVECVAERFERIARVTGLIRMSSDLEVLSRNGDSGIELNFHASDGTALEWGPTRLDVRDGQQVVVRITNRARHDVDVTLLYVDSDYGISCLFPEVGELNRLGAGESRPVATLDVNAETIGREHFVAIAVRSRQQAVDFAALEQPSLERVRREATRGESTRGVNSPVGELIQRAMFGQGRHRGVSRKQIVDYSLSVRTWNVLEK